MSTDAWAESAQTWDADEMVRAYASAAHGSLRSACEREAVQLANAHVLDFGCGTGLLTAMLAPDVARVVGVDTSPAMLERFAAKAAAAGWEHVSGVASLDHTERGGFDLIAASSVLGFVDDLGATITALAERLRPGGVLVQWDWEAEGEDAEYGLTRAAVRDAYAQSRLTLRSLDIGFEVPAGERVMRPLMAVARLNANESSPAT
jgi:predicted TPR repeat methyltransferase